MPLSTKRSSRAKALLKGDQRLRDLWKIAENIENQASTLCYELRSLWQDSVRAEERKEPPPSDI